MNGCRGVLVALVGNKENIRYKNIADILLYDYYTVRQKYYRRRIIHYFRSIARPSRLRYAKMLFDDIVYCIVRIGTPWMIYA